MSFTDVDIRERLQDRPFQPVRLVTTTGQTYDIYHPDLILIGYNFIIVGTAKPDSDHLVAERVTRIALSHITELSDLPKPYSPASNGSVDE